MTLLQVGDIFMLENGHTIYFKLPVHFVYGNRQGVFDELARTEVTVGEEKGGMRTDFLLGKYVVTRVGHQGGGTGHGPHDVYPDGHHVTAQKMFERDMLTRLGQPDLEITFYQTGSFTAMVENVKVIGKAKFKYEVVEQ